MLKRFGFRPKMYYLCPTKEERALDTRILSSFLVRNLTYKGCFTSDIEKNRSEIDFFLGFCENFLGQVVAFIADVERWRVKIYLFFCGADLTFLGSGRVFLIANCAEKKCTAPCLQGVSTEFVLIEKVRVCKVWDKHRSLSKHTTTEYKLHTHTLQATCGTLLGNENKHLTHTLQARCGTFTLLHGLAMRTNSLLTRASNVRYVTFFAPSFCFFKGDFCCPTAVGQLHHSCGAVAPQLWGSCTTALGQRV